MTQLAIRLHSQEGRDARGRIQSHQWAEVPADLAVHYMTGGLKRLRRMVESYFRYRFSPRSCGRVSVLWHHGEPVFRLRTGLGNPLRLLKLGRLRQTGTVDIYRGHMEILGGPLLDAEATVAHEPWPEDLPWVAPSAGEFDITAENQRPPYLGIFEMRVERQTPGCIVHLALRDFPLNASTMGVWLWNWSRRPLTWRANVDFLERELSCTATEFGHDVLVDVVTHSGVPEALPPLRRQEVGAAS